MVNNILDVLENLVQLSVNSVPCRADQTPENLEIFADIFEAIANIMTMQKEQLNLTIRNLVWMEIHFMTIIDNIIVNFLYMISVVAITDC